MSFNLSELISDISAAFAILEGVLPAIGSLVVAVHPDTANEATKVNAAVTAATSALTAAGIVTQTVSSLTPAIQAIIQSSGITVATPPASAAATTTAA